MSLRACVVAALGLAVVGCVSSPFAPVESRFRYRIPFEVGRTEFVGDDRLEVREVWGTRPRIEIGGDYLVLGRYHLDSAQRGRVVLYETTSNWTLDGADTDLLSWSAVRGDGEFALVHSMPGPGELHVSLLTHEDATRVANVYFGEATSPSRPPAAR
jgi:hypothetical protein